jgi:cell division septum initiation protein DivIVA
VYRVFEALDELVTILEEARGVPMTSNCIVPRGDALELLDEVRDALPAEIDDAQDVLDRKDELIGAAEHDAEQIVSKGKAEADRTLDKARDEAERLVSEARARAEHMLADANQEASRTVAAGRAEYDKLVGRARTEAERMIAAGREAYERSVEDGRAEQAQLVSQTDVVQAAHAESARIRELSTDETARQRAECDAYIDEKLAGFEELLAQTLRTVGKGRTQLRGAFARASSRPAAGAAPFDYSKDKEPFNYQESTSR